MNRQKFLAELAKLLSFMYEEDRLYALDMYERMFDIAEDNEQWLIQNLMSPTRQAVIIARSYDAKRRLSVSSRSKEEDGYEDESGETPPFVLAINKIFDDLFPDEEEAEEPAEDQVSFSDLGITEEKKPKRPRMPKAAVLLNQTQEFSSVTDSVDMEVLSEEKSDPDWLEELYAKEKSAEESETDPDPRINVIDRTEAFDSQADQLPHTEEPVTAAEPEGKAKITDRDDEMISGQESAATNKPETRAEAERDHASGSSVQGKKRRSIEELLGFRKEKKPDAAPADEKSEQVESAGPNIPEKPETQADEFAANAPAAVEQNIPVVNTVTRKKPDPAESEDYSAEAKRAESAGRELRVPDPAASAAEETEQGESRRTEVQAEIEQSSEAKILPLKLPDENAPVIRKPVLQRSRTEEIAEKRVLNVPRLILFLIIAIPSTLAVLAVLALLVALFLGLSIGVIALGSVLVVSAFSGFAVLADILLLLGAAIISLALGLLLLWLAFWLIGEVMTGWVRSVRGLQQEWCYKEVPAA